MKDFDAERRARERTDDERTFKIGGETFVTKQAVHPSVLTAWDAIKDDSGIAETLEVVDDVVLGLIEDRDGAHGRYLQVRANTDDPVTVDDLLTVVKWLLEAQTDRPTGQPSVSSPGPRSTVTPLTPASSSQAIPAA